MVYPGPDYNKVLVERQLDYQLAPDGDPEKPPKNAPKDWWLRIGILAGVVIGAVVGAIIGNKYYYLSPGSVLLLGLVVGAVVGGIVGAICGIIGAYTYKALVKGRSSRKPSKR